MSYKWNNPYEWLEVAASRWNKEQLYRELLNVAQRAGHDDLQDLYQTDMDHDGYFDELET